MSNKILPSFQGWSWEKTKTPVWKTEISESDNGKETRVQKWSYPVYKISLKYNFMTDNNINSVSLDKGELEILQGFINSVGGAFDDFLYLDDVENTAINQVFGIGDGVTTKFQLSRSLPDWIEPVKGLIDTPTIYIDDEEINDFSYDSKGLVTFSAAPADGKILKWSGQYYFRVRFQEDTIDLTRSWEGLWESITINLVTVK